MDGRDLVDALRSGPLLSDGGMGTSLVEAGIPVDDCFELLNVEQPDLVRGVHRGFVEAGARIVLTNTFGANRFALGRRGLGDRVDELNRAAVRLARDAGAELVAGSVGPLRVRLAPLGRVKPKEALEAYAEQVRALVAAEVDLVVIETQIDLNEAEQALAATRQVSDVAVVVTATFTRDDRTLLGSSPEEVAERLVGKGATAVGVNCGQGPAQAIRIVQAMAPAAGDVPLVARPNAGGPQQMAGRFLYPASPRYFGECAQALLHGGVRLIGGCCGTGPAHVAAMAEVLAAPRPARPVVRAAEPAPEAGDGHAAQRTGLEAKIADREFAVAVELQPPRGYSVAPMLAAAESLAEAGADVIDVADSPLARLRMSPWGACRLIQEHVGIETVLHFPTRGRNLLRLQGDLLAIHALGIRNLFVVLGDPVAIGDYPGGSDNVDVAPSGLISIITDSLNRGRDQQGASIGEPTSFFVGCAVNPNALDLDREVRLLRRKVDAGAGFALSQPVYEVERLRRLRDAYADSYGELTLPILAGVLPLHSARHAEFLHNEVPGLDIPPATRERMAAAGDSGELEGLLLAREQVEQLRTEVAGIYLMPQFGRFDIASDIVEAARARAPR